MNLIPLSSLKPGERCRLHHLEIYGGMRRRLQDLGFLPDTDLSVEFTAPSGSPMAVWCKHTLIALRRSDCRLIWVMRCA